MLEREPRYAVPVKVHKHTFCSQGAGAAFNACGIAPNLSASIGAGLTLQPMDEPSEKPTWDGLKDLLRWTAILFGQPSDLLHEELAPRTRALGIRSWLWGLEAIVRGLLLLMAAELPKPDPRPPRPTRRVRAAPVDPPANDAWPYDLESQRWTGVAFTYLPPTLRAGPARKRRRRLVPKSRYGTYALAFRFEALIRVAENPEPYAARMARRLHRNPGRIARVLSPPPERYASLSMPRADVADVQRCADRVRDAFHADTG